jgi:hypothetical protein
MVGKEDKLETTSNVRKKTGLLEILQALVERITGNGKPVEANSELGWRAYAL